MINFKDENTLRNSLLLILFLTIWYYRGLVETLYYVVGSILVGIFVLFIFWIIEKAKTYFR